MTKSSIAFSVDDEIVTTAHATGVANMAGDPANGEFAFRSEPPPWLASRIAQIDRLMTLTQNWDSYGALSIDLRSIAQARSILRELSFVDSMDAPIVTAAPNGNVALCWDDGDRSLDLEFLPNGAIKFVYLNSRDKRKDQEGTTNDLPALASLWTQW